MTVKTKLVTAFKEWRLAEYDHVQSFTEGRADAATKEAEYFAKELAWLAIRDVADEVDLQDSTAVASLELHDFYEGLIKLGEL